MKKVITLVLVVVMAVLALTGCSSNAKSADNGVKVYTVEGKHNSEEVNQWKKIYLLDDSKYVFTVYALDSQDSSIVTADFYMAGTYTLDGNTLTIDPGYGYVKAMNGDTPIEMAVSEGGAMYFAMAGAASYTFTLLEDGSFEVVE